MARLVVLEYRPQYLAGLLALLVGAVFEALVFLGPSPGLARLYRFTRSSP